jgi:hypothetical protein
MREAIPLLPLYACRACIGTALPLPWRAVTSGMKCSVHCASEPSTKDLYIQGLDVRLVVSWVNSCLQITVLLWETFTSGVERTSRSASVYRKTRIVTFLADNLERSGSFGVAGSKSQHLECYLSRRLRFSPRALRVGFIADKVTLVQVYIPVFLFSLVIRLRFCVLSSRPISFLSSGFSGYIVGENQVV